jgi:hypothetical protein
MKWLLRAYVASCWEINTYGVFGWNKRLSRFVVFKWREFIYLRKREFSPNFLRLGMWISLVLEEFSFF